MKTERRARRLLWTAALLAAIACSSDTTTPSPVVRVTVDGPAAVGAAVVRIDGISGTAVVFDDGLAYTSVSNGVATVVLIREQPGVIEFSFGVTSPNATANIAVVEVSGADDQALDPSGYSARVSP